MSFQPVLPLSGYAGWRFLSRTLETQQASFNKSAPVTKAADYFRENIAKAKTAADLVGDRRLLEVALGAFGLSEDINAKAFVQRVLDDGTMDPEALANKLSDKRYHALALEFGYGDLGARTILSGFADKIVARYEAQKFQEAVGEQNDDMRLALNLPTALAELGKSTSSERSQWFSVMGNPPLRAVFERALGFPSTFAAIDIDQQATAFAERAEATFGTSRPGDFNEPAMQEKLIRLFMLRGEIQSSAASPAAMALQLLQS